MVRVTPVTGLAALPSTDVSALHLPVDRPRLPLIIGEELFRDALVRERRRADRSNQPLLLFVVRIGQDPSVRETVVSALTAAKRASDVLGWFSERSALGVIIPEIATSDAAVLRSIETRLKKELSARLARSGLAGLSFEVHVHAPFRAPADFRLIDRLLSREAPSMLRAGMKRVLDLAGSLGLLAAVTPLLLVIAALVKLGSKGPVLFRQERIGEHGKPFRMLKFRTMRVDADPALHHEFVTRFIKASAGVGANASEAPFKIKDDPRVTPIGRFLRKTSLDELPQFWNVVRGDMSLVGPRPPLAYEVKQYQPWHCRRVLEAKPGITGLWQVTGRSRTTFDEMVRLDLRYAKSCSIWTDIKILLATPAAVIGGKGAA
jgi:exopolysaccharide biosynthesis polyprenyl glycosylphosphotransferase